MGNTVLIIVGVILIAGTLGFLLAKLLEKNNASQIVSNAKKEAANIVKEAKNEGESIKKDKILQAKEKFIELKSEHEKVILSRDKKINDAEKRTRDKESQVSSELAKNKKLNKEIEAKVKDYDDRLEYLDKRQADIDKLHASKVQQLEVISGLSADDAKEQLVESLKDQAKSDAMAFIQNAMEEAKLTAEQDAKKVIINTIQRIGTEEAVENCVSVFNLESDDVKGRIIGREGRNIRAIEAATGVEIIVDDTPEAIILSCFDSVRREVAKLCATMAAELGINPKLAKRAGLLHDIGKVPETESEMPHALLGMEWAEKYGEKPDVCNAIGAHHDEIEMKTLLAPIVQVCDAISGARPGARRQVLDSYIQRLKDLEDIAFGFAGVKKAYAIQAGRELRVIVESEKVNDEKASALSFEISQKIQTDMTYPGQVKITVIRETRAVNIAK